MKRVTATLVTDGSSDKLLKPLIELLIAEHTDLPYQVNCAEGLPPLAAGLESRIKSALENFPCDFLFVHRDDEGVGIQVRQREIEDSWPAGTPLAALVCVIPVRMTESWLIANEKPIRSAVGNPNGTEELGLPDAKDIESSQSPKEILFRALTTATGWNAHRRAKFNPHKFRHRVSELTDDLAPLRLLASFKHLEVQVKKHLSPSK